MFQISFEHTQPYWGDQEGLPHHQEFSQTLFRHLRNFQGFKNISKK